MTPIQKQLQGYGFSHALFGASMTALIYSYVIANIAAVIIFFVCLGVSLVWLNVKHHEMLKIVDPVRTKGIKK